MSSNFAPSWTSERVELTKALWTMGMSAADIARQLGGVTRNAVLGKLLREGMLGTRQPKASHKTARPRQALSVRRTHDHGGGLGRNIKNGVGKAFAKKKPPVYEAPPEEPASLNLHVAELREAIVTAVSVTPGTCKWPHGNGPFLFCGHPTHVDPIHGTKPYCAFHCRRAYISSPSRQVSAATEAA